MGNYGGTTLITARSETSFSLPIGVVSQWASQVPYSVPVGFLICDGSALLSSSYPMLYSIIGSGHGNGTQTGNGVASNLFPAWSNVTVYSPGQTVLYLGNTFIALQSNVGSPPVAGATWAVVHGFNLPDYRSRFHRGIDNMGGVSGLRGIDYGPRAGQLAGSPTTNVGSVEGDTFQGHYHNLYGSGVNRGMSYGGGINGNITAQSGIQARELVTNGSHGTPRVSSETRPLNIATLYLIRAY